MDFDRTKYEKMVQEAAELIIAASHYRNGGEGNSSVQGRVMSDVQEAIPGYKEYWADRGGSFESR